MARKPAGIWTQLGALVALLLAAFGAIYRAGQQDRATAELSARITEQKADVRHEIAIACWCCK